MGSKKTDRVNLDALIPRQDFEVVDRQRGSSPSGDAPIPVSELAVGKLHYQLLRKPPFQRETDDWNIDNVVTLIKSFRDGDLIPALILWRGNTGYTFVIDGAHRLSALIAWVNDDYGNGVISNAYYKHRIPKNQKTIAAECKRLVEKEVGAYSVLSKVLTLSSPSPEQVRHAANLSTALVTQTVHGDAKVAAKSFLAINQRAVGIDPTERYMIEHLEKPNVIAARAIVRSARGHQYWKKFEQATRERIERKASLIYNAIFEPEDAEPQSSLDLQPAGQAYSSNGLRIALDLVNVTNDVRSAPDHDDVNGDFTERFIEKTHAVVKYMAGEDAASMSLHPAVYFWTSTGNHQPSMFLAMVGFVQDLVMRNQLVEFTMIRAQFEEFLIGNSAMRKSILGRHGGWKKSLAPTRRMLNVLLAGLTAKKTHDQIEREILQLHGGEEGELAFLPQERASWRVTKSTLRRQASLDSALRCPICKARMVMTHMSDDHKQARAERGGDEAENAQLVHHYCNSGFKEHFRQRGVPLPEIASP